MTLDTSVSHVDVDTSGGEKFVDITDRAFIVAKDLLSRELAVTESWDLSKRLRLEEQHMLVLGIVRQGDQFKRLVAPGSGDKLDPPEVLTCEGVIDHIKAIHNAVRSTKAEI